MREALPPTVASVLDQLETERFTIDRAAAATTLAKHDQSEDGHTPIYIRVAVGFGAWIASLSFVGFLGATGLLESKVATLAFGLLLAGIALLLRQWTTGVFGTQFALSWSLAGRATFYAGLFSHDLRKSLLFVLITVGELLNFVFYPDRSSRFLSSSAAILALYTAICYASDSRFARESGLILLATAATAVWLRKRHLLSKPLGVLVEPASYALFTSLLLILGIENLREAARWGERSPWRGVVAGLGLTVLASGATISVAREVKASQRASVAALTSAIVLGAVTLRVPGILAAMLAIALGYHRRAPLLMGVGTVFLSLFGFFFYYQLTLSLLFKSLVLVLCGVVMLALRWRFLAREEGT